MEYQDYYKTLGVNKNATKKEIKVAYRKLARKYHPDVNPDDPQAEGRLKEINEAYEVLGDAEKRATYDQLGASWQRWQQSGQAGGFDWGQWANAGGQRVNVRYSDNVGDMFGEGGGFSDFFSSIFGGGSPGSRRSRSYEYRAHPQPGQDIEQDIEISLTEAYLGTTRFLRKDGRRLQVKIPAGAKTGTRARMRGEGSPGVRGGQAGNLYLTVKVGDDPRFERKEEDLYTHADVGLYTAIFGGKVRVLTLSGEVSLKLPPGSQNGQTFRLRGKGMPKLRKPGEYGDLYVQLDVRLPAELSPQQRELFEQLRKLG